MNCPICEEGILTPGTYDGVFNHNGGEITVKGLECCYCSACDAQPIIPDQIRRNQIRVAEAKNERA